MKPDPPFVVNPPGAGAGVADTERLYARLQRLGILARCNPDIPALADAYWRLAPQFRPPAASEAEQEQEQE